MKDQLISFDTAKLAKEKGFDWDVNNTYNEKGEHPRFAKEEYWEGYNANLEHPTEISAPTQSELQRWLREEHRVFINVKVNAKEVFNVTVFQIIKPWTDRANPAEYSDNQPFFSNFKTYELALEKGLLEGMKMLDNDERKARMIDDTETIMRTEYGLDKDDWINSFQFDMTPTEFANWFGNKHNLIDL